MAAAFADINALCGIWLGGFVQDEDDTGTSICGTVRIRPLINGTVSVGPMVRGKVRVKPGIGGTVRVGCEC